MPEFTIAVEYMVSAEVTIESETLWEAERFVKDNPHMEIDGNVSVGPWKINESWTDELNPEWVDSNTIARAYQAAIEKIKFADYNWQEDPQSAEAVARLQKLIDELPKSKA